MTMTDWTKIAKDIEVNYAHYDAFVVLHGTDTMAYTVLTEGRATAVIDSFIDSNATGLRTFVHARGPWKDRHHHRITGSSCRMAH